VTVHKLSPRVKAAHKNLSEALKLMGKAAFLLGTANEIDAMVFLAQAGARVEERLRELELLK